MKKKTIKLNFSDFYNGFDKINNQFYQIISKKYNIIIDEENPDYLIYSCFGKEFLRFDCIRIFYTGENLVPDFNLCDYGISFFNLDFEDRYLRYPNFLGYGSQTKELLKPKNLKLNELNNKTKFCNFIYSNSNADPRRDEFYFLLSKYKLVHSAGKHLTNVNRVQLEGANWAQTKVEYQKKFKFSIAFENSTVNGYTTEKIMHAFIANTIPIYWGNPLIENDFNTESFINCHDYENFEEVIQEVKRLDNNDQEYINILNQPPFNKDKMPVYLNHDYLLTFFEKILNQSIKKAKRRCNYGRTKIYINELSPTKVEQTNISTFDKILFRIKKALQTVI